MFDLFNFTPAQLTFLFVLAYNSRLVMVFIILLCFYRMGLWAFRKIDAFLDRDIPNRVAFGTFCGISLVGILWLIHLG